MSASCPISTKKVDTNVVRTVSLQVALAVLLYLFTQHIVFAIFLLFDFSLRLMNKTAWSPFYILSSFLIKRFHFTPRYQDASPKRFALYLGFYAALFLVIFSFLDFLYVSFFVALVLLVCSMLETLFDFCIGCKLYYAIQILGSLKKYKFSKNPTKAKYKDDRDFY